MNGWKDTASESSALAAFGLVKIEDQREELEIWPENWLALQVMSRMTTQLNVSGMGGVIGLRYESLPFVLDVCEVGNSERAEVMDGLQIMERHLVKLVNEKR